MTDRANPVAIDLMPYVDALGGAREFLRLWASEDGTLSCFVNPRGLGADPALFGAALREAVDHAAIIWSKATGIPVDEAFLRIRDGFDQHVDRNETVGAELAPSKAETIPTVDAKSTGDLPPPVVVSRKDS